MFTGIIEEKGRMLRAGAGPAGGKLVISARTVLSGTIAGDSIAVNGVCLTVTDLGADWFKADVMPETFRKTNLHLLKAGDTVNLERAMTAGGRLGGHIVSGHVDGIGRIKSIHPEGNALVYHFTASPSLLRYVAARGSVAVDGISLTVADVGESCFSLSLIPHTRRETNLEAKKVGDLVNLEMDILAKYVERLLVTGKKEQVGPTSGITLELLQEKGF